MVEEQCLFSHHQHVPIKFLPQLYEQSEGIRRQAIRQVFDWVTPLASIDRPFSETEHDLRLFNPPITGNAPLGVVWVCGLIGDDSLHIRLNSNPKLLSEE